MAIAATLSVLTVAGIQVAKSNATKTEMIRATASSTQLVMNLSHNGTSSLTGSGDAERQALSKPDPLDPNNPNSLDSPLNPMSMNNPNNPDSPFNLNNPNNPNHPNFNPPTCASPCHTFTDPYSNITSCIITAIDYACLGGPPASLPTGCVYLESGPGDPKYQPAPDGDGAACPYTPTCTAPFVVSPKYHECRCPGEVSDCVGWMTGGNGGANIPFQKQSKIIINQ